MLACASDEPGMRMFGAMVGTYRRNLGRKGDGLRDREIPLLYRALEVDVRDLLAKIGGRADKANKAVLDLEKDVGPLLDVLRRVAGGLDDKLLAAIG